MSTFDALIIPERDHWSVELCADRDKQLEGIALAIKNDEPALSVLSPYAPGMHGEILDAPSLVIEDHGAIRLFEHSGDEAYSYRSLLLAGDNDLVALGVERSGGFEAYCRDWLGLGTPLMLTPQAAADDDPLTTRCARDARFIDQVVTHADTSQGLNILPYMGTWDLWQLAGKIATRTRAPVRVVAPPPQLTRRANDKIWFARLAQSVCGYAAIPPARAASNFVSLCRLAVELAGAHATIAIKLPDSASSAGNLVLDAELLRDISWQALHDRLERRLYGLGWNGSFPLQVVAWEQVLSSSPSVHLWIPALDQGRPLVEAIFDQHTSGLEREFDGARPCQLEFDWQLRIVRQAIDIARVLQYLGYFGRCSLDAIIAGQCESSAQLHWVECNGRWGGVSLPLSLNRRLDTATAETTPMVIFEQAHQQLPARDLKSVLQMLEPWLYRRGVRNQGAVLLSPGRLLDGTGFEFMVRANAVNSALRIGSEVANLLENN